jgi:glycosyltransferase involved in cell wall biosynthesis
MGVVKNVCMIVQHPYPNDVRVRKEARALLARKHRVSVIALRDFDEPKCEIVEGVSVYRGFFSKKRAGVLRYIFEYLGFFLYAFVKLNLLDRKERFDVVHVNTLPDFLVFSTVIQKLKGRRIVLDLHEIMPEFFMSKYCVGHKHPVVRLLRVLERVSLKYADDIITVNEPIKRIFQHRAVPNKPIAVVMNTVSATTVRNSVKQTHEGFNCVYHGTVTDIYGLDTAILGFAKAKEICRDMMFHIFGEGPSLPQLKRLVHDLQLEAAVVFHGAIPYENMMDALAEMDLGLLAIRKDDFLNLSLSNKLAEYVYLKIPVISSDLDTVMYYFDDRDLLFFQAGDPEDLSRKIEFAYGNKSQMQERAEAACKKSLAFNWDVMAKRYVNVIEGH